MKKRLLAILGTIVALTVFSGCNFGEPDSSEPEHTHDWATEWTTDADGHWHQCECGEKDSVVAHIGGTSTCTKKAECEVCNVEYGTVADHVYDNACDVECNECQATRMVGDHVYDNACDVECNECQATRTVGDHVYDNACDTECNECQATRTVGDHVYDHAYDTECNECGDKRAIGDEVWDPTTEEWVGGDLEW